MHAHMVLILLVQVDWCCTWALAGCRLTQLLQLICSPSIPTWEGAARAQGVAMALLVLATWLLMG